MERNQGSGAPSGRNQGVQIDQRVPSGLDQVRYILGVVGSDGLPEGQMSAQPATEHHHRESQEAQDLSGPRTAAQPLAEGAGIESDGDHVGTGVDDGYTLLLLMQLGEIHVPGQGRRSGGGQAQTHQHGGLPVRAGQAVKHGSGSPGPYWNLHHQRVERMPQWNAVQDVTQPARTDQSRHR